MRLDPRGVEEFMRQPQVLARAVLLHGDDPSLVSNRARRLTEITAGSVDDPFSVVELDRSSVGYLLSDFSAFSLNGTRRVVRFRDGGDFLCDPLVDALASKGAALIIVEAGLLQARSKLRVLFEGAAGCVAVGCTRPDTHAVARFIRERLALENVECADDTVLWLASQFPDLGPLASEIEKLVTLSGTDGVLSFELLEACGSGGYQHALDHSLYAATAGLVLECDRALTACVTLGVVPVQMVRATMHHFERLMDAQRLLTGGAHITEVARSLKPAVLRSRLQTFFQAARLWPAARLGEHLNYLLGLERACKRTGAPADLLVAHHLRQVSVEAETRSAGRPHHVTA